MKKISLLIALVTIGFASVSFINSTKKRFVVTDYGAKGDSLTLNTAAIQKTIDVCSSKGGGVVVIPKGIFTSGAIFLKKGVDLLIEEGATLKGSINPNDYPQIKTRWKARSACGPRPLLILSIRKVPASAAAESLTVPETNG